MSFAPYFAKAAQSAAQLLTGFSLDDFCATLLDTPVAVAWDRSAAETAEGRAALELTIDLLARFYPCLRLSPLDLGASSVLEAAENQARRINPAIDLARETEGARAVVVIGATEVCRPSNESGEVFYVGSDAWVAKFSRVAPQGSGTSRNVFGAGAAACIGVANVFRFVFAEGLQGGDLDGDIQLSVLDLGLVEPAPPAADGRHPEQEMPVDVGEVHLAGVGAIGHGAVWAWRRTPWIRGSLYLVDGEEYDGTNPQRYVETESDAHGPKVVASRMRTWASPDLNVVAVGVPWAEHLGQVAEAKGGWSIDAVALAIDNVPDRIMAQAALPRRIYNSWTQPANLGISRHRFLEGPCVACLYSEPRGTSNRDEVVATSLGISDPADIKRIRQYLDDGRSLTQEDVIWIGAQGHFDEHHRSLLEGFVGRPIEALYSEAVCGGLLLALGRGAVTTPAEIPIAFQSALAGILLAAEVVVDSGNLRATPTPAKTEINLLRPLGRRLNTPHTRPAEGGCLCQDLDYRTRYSEKWLVST